MKGVTQTRVAPQIGNCLEAAVASILECSIDDVPDLEDDRDWDIRIAAWLAQRGFTFRTCSAEEPPSGWSIAVGPSRRGGHTHAVVAENGDLCWDPHPAQTFFDGAPIKYFIAIERAA